MNVMGKSSCIPYVKHAAQNTPSYPCEDGLKKEDIAFRSVFSKAEDFCGESVKNLDAADRFSSYVVSENGSMKAIIIL